MLIYLAHPVDSINKNLTSKMGQQITYVRHLLKNSNHVLYHPAHAFVAGKKATVSHEIETINRHAQEQADGVLVILPKGAKSWGVPAEIERARIWNQPVAIISDEDPTWSMPHTQTHPLTVWFRPDTGNFAKAIKYLETHTTKKQKPTEVRYTKITPDAKTPERAYGDDAGYDLYVAKNVTIPPNEFVDIPTYVAVQLASETWGLLTGRSSTTRRRGLLVNQGVIDPGYRGELFVGVWNLTDQPVEVKTGERIAQLILMPNVTAVTNMVEVDRLDAHPRGVNGFGSTGS
jgi:dUTP pyrophosphatase